MKPILTIALLALAALAACRSAPTTYHVLQPLEAPAPRADRPSGGLVALSVVRFPTYLERIQLVHEESPGTLALSDVHAWAEPLDEGFARVLAEDLAVLLDRPVVLSGPLTRPPRAELGLEVDVGRLEARADGTLTLVVTWMATDAQEATLLAPRRTRVVVPPQGKGPAANVAAVSAALSELARRMAAEISGAS